MAEAMLVGVAKSVVGQLSSPALEEALLVWNFEKDLKRLGETIETITCFIHDAEQRQSETVKLWLSRFKAVLYDADDLFDAIAARALRKKAMDGSKFKKEVILFFSKSNQLAFVIKTAHDIKDIRECLDCIKDDMSQFQFQYQRIEVNLSHRVLEREERHSFVDSVIGRDQEKEDIINLLLAENTRQRSFEVISVIGFGGLGKTTLAQLVYNDERVQKGFDLCLWTCINYLFDLESVLVTILTSALNSKPRDLGLDQLQRELRETIGGKKYLLVLDDLRDENLQNWGGLETLLACGKIGSKVLITTRKVGVAKCLKALEPFYKLGLLSEESAWSLFVKVAFKDEGFVGDSELDSLGKQIIRKCGYSPLLVTLIGRLLARRKKDKEVWLSFLENEFAGVVAGDIGDGNMTQIMIVSYIDLPATLKRCFAYCSIFPEDHEFEKDELVRMWIAQGFVEPFAGKSLEEIGDGYFFSMIDACFFQEVEKYEWDFGVVRYACKMHNLLHELATQVAGSESIRYTDEDSRNMDHLRHISITPPFSNSLSLFQNLSSCSKSLRSLTEHHIEINSLKLVLEKFRNLRTLVLPKMRHKTLPDSFGGLIHLRYLDLSQNDELIALPKSICKLHHLQTLLLTDCSNLVKFPSTLAKLVSLRHLFLEGCSTLDSMPSGFAGLTSLVSLDRFIIHPVSGGLRYLHGLDMLCGTLKLELPMNGWTDCVEDAKEANMASKGQLSGLSIKWERSDEEELKGEERKAVADALQPHVHLRYLEIEGYTSDKLPRWFSSLLNLKKIRLWSCRKVEYLDESVRCDWLLPHLKVLELRDMECLRGWCRGATSTVQRMPRVSKLVIFWCRSLVENMPLFDALEHLTLWNVNVKLVNMLLSCPTVQCSPGCHNSKLQVLYLSFIEGLECLPEGLIKHLTSLKVLDISDCEDLRWISRRGLACLTSLEELHITSSRDVILLEDEDDNKKMCTKINNMYHGLQRLRYLEVPWHPDMYYGLRFLTSLQELELIYYEEQQVEADNRNSECLTSAPQQLQRVELKFKWVRKCCFPKWSLHLPCLQELALRECGEMNVDDWVAQHTQSTTLVSLFISSNEELLWVQNIPWNLLPSLRTLDLDWKLSTIPDRIQRLTSLQHLELWDCQNLGEIPKWMKKLTSLHKLSMRECSPKLEARCTPQNGTDWDLISHIPHVYTSR